MTSITLKNVSKSFGSTKAVAEVSLEIASGEFFFLLGASGCGKTTVLRLIAGFYHPDQGKILFGAQDITSWPPQKRNTGMVFQNYALWPHLTVYENVEYGLNIRKLAAPEKKKKVEQALTTVQMLPYQDRFPNQLSGGQQQRVALARALVIEPEVLLFDEPLSNLDAKLRLEMRSEIKRIHEETKITTVYVTHDQKEALSMADRLAVMHDGRIEQIGTPHEVYHFPRTRAIAEFIGEVNVFPGTVQGRLGAREWSVVTGIGTLKARSLEENVPTGAKVLCLVRPEAVHLAAGPDFSTVGQVIDVTYLGETEQYVLRIGDQLIKAVRSNPLTGGAKRGDAITLSFSSDQVLLLKP
jgi:iron(III) transport system ATP-binding protein